MCLEVAEINAENPSDEVQENQQRWTKEGKEKEQVEETNEEREAVQETKKTSRTNGGSVGDMVDQPGKEDGWDGICDTQNEENRREGPCSFDQLPYEKIGVILETALRSCNSSDSSDACILFQWLRNVCSRFRQCIDRFIYLLPKIYYREGSPGIINVRRLIKEFGPSSGLILEIKRIINSNCWHYAWVQLYAIGLGWFCITNIFWRK